MPLRSAPQEIQLAPSPLRDREAGSLPKILERPFAGQPIIGVDVETRDALCPESALQESADTLARLQAISEAASTPQVTLIPYSIHGAWVIGPERRLEVTPDIARVAPFWSMSRSTLVQELLRSMTISQLRSVGSESGIGYDALTPDQRTLLEVALRPVLTVEGFDQGGTGGHQVLKRIEEPVDLKSVRIRANLAKLGFRIDLANGYASIEDNRHFSGKSLSFEGWQEDVKAGGASVPAYVVVANRYKPSDLDGNTYGEPIGIEGRYKLSDVLTRMAIVTGLHLVADEPYRDREVFIGASRITCGALIDGLRLALTAAWRQIGDTYILAWDRSGIRAVQTYIDEATQSAQLAVHQFTHRTDSRAADQRVADALSFSNGDPLALTDEQRRSFDGNGGRSDQSGIPFADLTAGQQAYIRSLRQRLVTQQPEKGAAVQKSLTESELQNLQYDPMVFVELSVHLPDTDWLPMRTVSSVVSLMRPKALEDQTDPRQSPRAIASVSSKMIRLNARVRAIMVPVLGPGRLTELARQMKRAGLNTLFYPALFDGYSTFPSGTFPLHPSLFKSDGLASAVAAMKPMGIRVVAYVQTLAWQREDGHTHWLRAHRDWIDLDVLGRTRLEWAAAHPDVRPKALGVQIPMSNYVSPNVTDVRNRLNSLLGEIAERKDISGLGLTEWSPLMDAAPNRKTLLPTLGYSLADRIAAVRATLRDPLDLPNGALSFIPPELHERPNRSGSIQLDPHIELMRSLLHRGKEIRPDWTTYVLNELNECGYAQATSRGGEPADVSTRAIALAPTGSGGLTHGVFVRMPSLNEGRFDARDMPAGLNHPAGIQVAATLEPAFGGRWDAMVLDFREAPNDISPSLRMIQDTGALKSPESRPGH
jgi:hypothetical protein